MLEICYNIYRKKKRGKVYEIRKFRKNYEVR